MHSNINNQYDFRAIQLKQVVYVKDHFVYIFGNNFNQLKHTIKFKSSFCMVHIYTIVFITKFSFQSHLKNWALNLEETFNNNLKSRNMLECTHTHT